MNKFILIIAVVVAGWLPSRAVDFIDADEIFDVIDDNDLPQPIAIEFWADWCPGSRVVNPDFAQVAREFSHSALFFKIDIDDYPEVVNYFGFNMLPCIIVLYPSVNDSGEPTVKWVGARGLPYLKLNDIRQLVREAIEYSE